MKKHTKNIQGKKKKHTKNIQGKKKHTKNVQGRKKKHTRREEENTKNIQEKKKKHTKNIQGKKKKHTKNIQGKKKKHTKNIQGKKKKHTKSIQGKKMRKIHFHLKKKKKKKKTWAGHRASSGQKKLAAIRRYMPSADRGNILVFCQWHNLLHDTNYLVALNDTGLWIMSPFKIKSVHGSIYESFSWFWWCHVANY